MKRFWVVGAAGMLGTEVMRHLGDEAIGTDREVDVTDAAAVTAFATTHAPRAIINCAAFTRVDACETEEAAATAVNGTGVANLARIGVPLVHVSTDYVFDGTATRPYQETDPVAPINAYGRSKLVGERAVGPDGYVVRTSWLFGPAGPNFVATMLRLMAERPEVKVVDDQRGRPTYAPDLAAVLVDLARGGAAPGIYHFANAGDVTWFGFASAIQAAGRAAGRPLPAQVLPTTAAAFAAPAPRPAWSVLDTTKLERALGRAPRPWTAALRDYLEAIA